MKSHEDMLLSIALELLEEARVACVYQSDEVERDRARLVALSIARGLALFTLDLPSLDSQLTSSLDARQLSASGPLTGRRSKTDPRPTFLWGLWSLVFDITGCLIEEADPNAILMLRQIFCLGKRIELECSPARLEATLENYHAIESEIVPPLLYWDGDDLGSSSRDLRFSNSFGHPESNPLFCYREGDTDPESTWFVQELLRRLDFTSQAVSALVGAFNPIAGEKTHADGRFKHGPGAVADQGEGAFKYSFPNWPRKLGYTFPFDWCGSHTLTPETFPSEHEPPSKLLAVPKTAKGPRLIAAEPVAHQWCQQKVGTWLAGRFNATQIGWFIDLSDQKLSQEMVREASISGDLTTLDLSDASDRLSCRHVESLLRGNRSLLEAVHAVRTRWVVDRVTGKTARFLKIKKFAAQGSALTFPMQSLFFLACCLAACGVSCLDDLERLKGKVRVFGDDLIVPKYAHAGVKLLLTHLGLKVNVAKSFCDGNFRESCGMDCWKGHDVTPLKPKSLIPDTPEHSQGLIDTSNNFYLRGFWRISQLLDSTMAEARFELPLARVNSGVPSLVSFVVPPVDTFRKRWHKALQRWEIRLSCLNRQGGRTKQDESATLLQYFTEAPKPFERWTPGCPEPVKWSSGVARNRTARFAARWVDGGPFGLVS